MFRFTAESTLALKFSRGLGVSACGVPFSFCHIGESLAGLSGATSDFCLDSLGISALGIFCVTTLLASSFQWVCSRKNHPAANRANAAARTSAFWASLPRGFAISFGRRAGLGGLIFATRLFTAALAKTPFKHVNNADRDATRAFSRSSDAGVDSRGTGAKAGLFRSSKQGRADGKF